MKSFAAGPWTKPSQIILAIDIGTTHSALSFAFLNQGAPQSVHRVSEWPGQEAQRSESKIPSLVWYDRDKQAVSFGAEALSAQAEEDAEDQHWMLARHFKLHLHPSTMQDTRALDKEPLPVGISLSRIYTDFIHYILKHAQVFFESHILDGVNVWKRYQPTMQIVIAHPNGWGFKEQNFLRRAAVAADSTRSKDLGRRIRFISEAEASVHFCMFHSDLDSRMEPGVNFAVCDAGGSTVDTTVYRVVSKSPVLRLEEKKVPACIQAGGIFVNIAAERYLRRIFTSVGLGQEDIEEYVKKGMKDFELGAKKAFQNVINDQTIDTAGSRFNNGDIRVRRGRMTLPGQVVQSFFQQCIKEIVESVSEQISGISVQHILLVGGFGDSLFLRQTLSGHFGQRGCHVTISNDATAKAVADGAVIWCVKSSVISRVARFTYGTWVRKPFDRSNPEHRGHAIQPNVAGEQRVHGVWKPLINKGTSLAVQSAVLEPVRKSYLSDEPILTDVRKTIYVYTKDGPTPYWLFKENREDLTPGFEKVCVITADLSALSRALVRKQGPNGPWCTLHFEIGVRFGNTELEAFLQWDENGVTRTGPASILPSSLMD